MAMTYFRQCNVGECVTTISMVISRFVDEMMCEPAFVSLNDYAKAFDKVNNEDHFGFFQNIWEGLKDNGNLYWGNQQLQ